MHEDTIYRCVNPACARLMPRPVRFCPWCGTAQATGQPPASGAANAAGLAAASAAVPASATTLGTTTASATARAAAGRDAWSDAPVSAVGAGAGPDAGAGAVPPAPGPDAARAAAAASAASAAGTAAARAGLAGADARAGAGTPPGAGAQAGAGPGTDAQPGARTRGAGLGTLFGHGARAPAAQPGESVPRPPIAPRPARPGRAPIQLRWWVLFLLVLWGVWLVARPNSSRKIEGRIDHAIALAQACQARDAQSELIALRATRATDAQLERVQSALNEGAAACTRKRQRDKAWQDASSGAEAALTEQNPERARARLQAFTRRWGEDERTRALRTRIDEASHPLAAPEG